MNCGPEGRRTVTRSYRGGRRSSSGPGRSDGIWILLMVDDIFPLPSHACQTSCLCLRIGLVRKACIRTAIERAVKLAKEVDQVILCACLNRDWESEGYDRSHMDLPLGSNNLIRAVITANPNTAIVVESGTPVTMSWMKEAPAILQTWYGRTKTVNAIADVVFGTTNTSG